MQGNFIKDEKKFLLLFKKIYFHCLNHMCLMKMSGNKKDIPGNEKFMPKTFKLNFLEKNNQTELSKKENEFLYKYFKYKNIDELMVAFKNTKTDEELD